jgi:hypothetical protein
MSIPDRPLRSPEGRVRLPADDPTLFELDLDGLAVRWAEAMARAPMTAEEMTGADARAQRMGVPGIRLMEQAGSASGRRHHGCVASGRLEGGPVLILWPRQQRRRVRGRAGWPPAVSAVAGRDSRARARTRPQQDRLDAWRASTGHVPVAGTPL